MSPQSQALQTIRALKGPPLTVIFTMLVLQEPVSQKRLCALTGHTDKTVENALNLLKELGYVSREHRYEWRLAPDAQVAFLLPGVGDSPTPAPTTTTTPSLPPEREDSLEKSSESVDVVVVARRNRRISDSVQVLRSGGIGDPKRSRLARMDHVTPAYARAHVRKAKRNKTDTALLIYRIEQADPAPDTQGWYESCPVCYNTLSYCHFCPVCCRCSECCACEPYPGEAEAGRDEAGCTQGREGPCERMQEPLPPPVVAPHEVDSGHGRRGQPGPQLAAARRRSPESSGSEPARTAITPPVRDESSEANDIRWFRKRRGMVKLGDVIASVAPTLARDDLPREAVSGVASPWIPRTGDAQAQGLDSGAASH